MAEEAASAEIRRYPFPGCQSAGHRFPPHLGRRGSLLPVQPRPETRDAAAARRLPAAGRPRHDRHAAGQDADAARLRRLLRQEMKPAAVEAAYKRLKPHITRTPIL